MNLRNCMFTVTAALLFALNVPIVAHAEGDAGAGRAKAETCMGCHGVESYFNVYPTYHVPKLGGQSAGYIASALKAYKAGERNHETMRANAENLSDQDIADIAAFLANYGK
ncbi:MAG: c-type cytochrome [Gammaproteobacteria bacterium]